MSQLELCKVIHSYVYCRGSFTKVKLDKISTANGGLNLNAGLFCDPGEAADVGQNETAQERPRHKIATVKGGPA